MKYFLPDWDDRVDPGYDFKTERMTLGRVPQDDLYAHELLSDRVYDGILVSRMALGEKGRKREAVEKHGLKRYLRLLPDLELMGDCGAFGYVKEKTPPYSTPELISYYDRLGFDYGVSIDHIVLPEFADQQQYRYQLTIDNALQFLAAHRSGGYRFTPIGAVQGWDVDSYISAAQTLVDAGYTYLALGGLVRSTTKQVASLVTEIATALPNVKLHVFGVARANLHPLFTQLGVESADSASPLRQAWLSGKDNYYTNGKSYAAIRIPVTKEDRGKKHTLVGRAQVDFATLKEAESKALKAVRSYGRKELGLMATERAIKTFDRMLAPREYDNDENPRFRLYRETLKARPWEKCPCEICASLGIEVIIFRGNNRNRRRGFHNLWTLRQRLAHQERSPSSHVQFQLRVS